MLQTLATCLIFIILVHDNVAEYKCIVTNIIHFIQYDTTTSYKYIIL